MRSPPGVHTFTSADAAAEGVDVAVMVGGYPRKAGEERKDVMAKNVRACVRACVCVCERERQAGNGERIVC
jgi:malate/lactate dehydrogenase